MSSVTLRAYAKINLSLDVVGKREDGYHLLESVFQGISLYDDVRVMREEGSGGITVRCNLPYIPTDRRNIVYKVAETFFKAARISNYQVTIELNKTIPSGAGLGGGSADGAAVFSALCRLYKASFSTEEATALLVPLGADIPFFLHSGTMLARGVGEILTPAPPLQDCCIVLAKPKAGASTKEIFCKLKEVGIPRHPDTPGVLRSLETGDLGLLARSAGNVLENATIPLCPQIGKLKGILQKCGADLALMTGSGSTVFGIFTDEKQARRAMRTLRKHTRLVYLTRPICRPMKTE
ncbi:MAG: 4-(cytidine 5'-diphospho)-2-C-methyl-D-erythritol kinase [Clostridia bacterium]|nr:4-(cytidine 5'-diphospho)-2-C-methyl-D-erythritol kinase [Clostridia bacterium]